MFEVVLRDLFAKQTANVEAEYIERYRQTVDVLDIRAVMAAVNQKPRKPRTPKAEK